MNGVRAASSAAAVRLETFGTAALVRLLPDGARVAVLDASKLLALVTYLAAAPRRSASREHLTDLLWGNLDPAEARHALRHARWQIHQKTARAISIEGDDETLSLQSPLAWDRDEFLAAADGGDCVTSVQLYAGEFFPNFASPGSTEFEHWLDRERRRLHGIFARCGEVLVRQYLTRSQVRDAIGTARRVRDADPQDLTGWRLLLESLIAASDTLTAAVEADALERLIAENALAIEPSVRALLAQVRRQPPVAGHARATSPLASIEMVGREREFAALVHAWELASQGHTVLVSVTAPPGFGKSRLLREFAARLQSLHARHVLLRATRASRDVDYAVVSDIVSQLAALPGARAVSVDTAQVLVGLNPALAAHYPGAAGRARRLEPVGVRNALRELLEAVAFEKPLALLLDDVHWCDAPSRRILAAALEGLERKPVLCVASDRQGGLRGDFTRPARVLPLPPLGSDSIAILLGSVARLPDDERVARFSEALARYSNGSPLHILEILQLALERGALAIADSRWQLHNEQELAHLLRAGSALRERVRHLPAAPLLILRLLATADEGLGADTLAQITGQPRDNVQREVDRLELDGFVCLEGDHWELVHEEFGIEALAAADPAERRGMEQRIGLAFARQAGNATARRRAARHLRAAEDWDALADLTAATLRQRAREGQTARPARVARELLGGHADTAAVQRLVRALPWSTRLGLAARRRRALAIAAGAAAVIAALVVATARTPAQAGLYATLLEPTPDGTILWELPMQAFAAREQARPGSLMAHAIKRATLSQGAVSATPVDGRAAAWLVVRPSPDSGGLDIYSLDAHGKEERLTFTKGDDVYPDLSPDGRWLLYATGAFSPLQRTDIVLLDMRTRRSRQLTLGEASDRMPRWSPSGTRIGFVRRHFDRSLSELCVTALDARPPQCHEVAGELRDARWVDDSSMLLRFAGSHGPDLRMDVTTGARQEQPGAALPYHVQISPDGRWLLCDCAAADVERNGGRLLQLMARAADSSYEPVNHEAAARPMIIMPFRRVGGAPRYLDSLVVIGDSAVALLGVPFVIGAAGRDASGRPLPVHGLVYRASDTTVATVDSSGTVLPRRAGSVTIHISAGGWRSTDLALHVRPNARDVLLDETWSRGIAAPWRAFGVPAPRTVQVPDEGWAFENNGDGEHTSGAYVTQPFDGSAGLTLVTRLSTPVTLPQWQTQMVMLTSVFDLPAFARWDHVTANPWQDGRLPPMPPQTLCRFQFAGGDEGADYARVVLAGAERLRTPESLPRRLASGAWYEVTLQVFPDGRCGVAVDGHPLALAGPHHGGGRRYLLLLHGASHDTRIRVGPLRITRGVRSNIDWSAVPR